MVKISKFSMLSGKFNSMMIPMNAMQFDDAWMKWAAGALIQDAFPTLNAEEREFLKSGITPEEWAEAFGEEE